MILKLPNIRASLIEEANPGEFLTFHYNPETVSDNQSAEYSYEDNSEWVFSRATLKTTNPRQVSFLLRLSDWGDDIVKGNKARKSVEASIQWLRDRIWKNPKVREGGAEPPKLFFPRLKNIYGVTGFVCILKSMNVVRTVMNPFSPADALRAEVEITLEEYIEIPAPEEE